MIRGRQSFDDIDDRTQSTALNAVGGVHHIADNRFDHEDLGLRVPLSVRMDVLGDVFWESTEPGTQYYHLGSGTMVGCRQDLDGIWSVQFDCV